MKIVAIATKQKELTIAGLNVKTLKFSTNTDDLLRGALANGVKIPTDSTMGFLANELVYLSGDVNFATEPEKSARLVGYAERLEFFINRFSAKTIQGMLDFISGITPAHEINGKLVKYSNKRYFDIVKGA